MSYLGTTKIGKMFLGAVEIAKAYLGDDLVFQKGGSPSPRLPAGYTELSYVATNSQAWIDTGIYGGTSLVILVKFYVGNYTQYGAIYGNYVDENHKANRTILNSSTELLVAGGNNLSKSITGFTINAEHTLEVASSTAKYDGTSYSIPSQSKTANSTNICLGNRGVSTAITRDLALRIYSFEVKQSGTTIMNLVPAKRDLDDAVGFYDLIAEDFVKSLTGTEFTAGPSV